MARSSGQDEEAKRLLLAAIPRLRKYARMLTRSPHEADDLTQIALERALVHIDQWRMGTNMQSWLLRIATNAWIDEMRLRKRRGPSVPLDVETAREDMDGRRVTGARADLEAARAAMEALPEDQRVVLALVALEGLSYQDVADTLNIPIGTVMSRLSRARRAVADTIEGKRTGANG